MASQTLTADNDNDVAGKAKFVIPKKRLQTAEIMVKIDTQSREFQKDVLPILSKNMWSSESLSRFVFVECQLISNPVLNKKFEDKRKEFKSYGYSEKDQTISYGFLHTFSEAEVACISTDGIRCGHSTMGMLGKPEMGVYLSRYADILSTVPLGGSSGGIVIFKVLKGKAKAVALESKDLEPSPQFDCHISKETQSQLLKAPVSQLFYLLQMYLYEYVDGEVVETPRNILPMAYVRYMCLENDPKSKQLQVRVPKSRTLWSGDLRFGNMNISDVQIQASYSTLKPCGLGKSIALKKLLSFDSVACWTPIRELLLSSNTMLTKKRELRLTSCNDYLVYHKLTARSNSSLNQLRILGNKLAQCKCVGLSGLRGGTSLLVIPNSDFCTTLGIPVCDDEKLLHCIFISYRSVTSGVSISGPFDVSNSSCISADSVVCKTKLVECFKQLIITSGCDDLFSTSATDLARVTGGEAAGHHEQSTRAAADKGVPAGDDTIFRLAADPRVRKRIDNVLHQSQGPSTVLPETSSIAVVEDELPIQLPSNSGAATMSETVNAQYSAFEMDKPYDPGETLFAALSERLPNSVTVAASVATDYSYSEIGSVVSLSSENLELMRLLGNAAASLHRDDTSDVSFVTPTESSSATDGASTTKPNEEGLNVDVRQMSGHGDTDIRVDGGTSLSANRDVDLRPRMDFGGLQSVVGQIAMWAAESSENKRKSSLSGNVEKQPRLESSAYFSLPPEFGQKDVDLRTIGSSSQLPPKAPERRTTRLGGDYFREVPGAAFSQPVAECLPQFSLNTNNTENFAVDARRNISHIVPDQEPTVSSTTPDAVPYTQVGIRSGRRVCLGPLNPLSAMDSQEKVRQWLHASVETASPDIVCEEPVYCVHGNSDLETEIDIPSSAQEQELENVQLSLGNKSVSATVIETMEVSVVRPVTNLEARIDDLLEGQHQSTWLDVRPKLPLAVEIEQESRTSSDTAYDPETGFTPLEYARAVGKEKNLLASSQQAEKAQACSRPLLAQCGHLGFIDGEPPNNGAQKITAPVELDRMREDGTFLPQVVSCVSSTATYTGGHFPVAADTCAEDHDSVSLERNNVVSEVIIDVVNVDILVVEPVVSNSAHHTGDIKLKQISEEVCAEEFPNSPTKSQAFPTNCSTVETVPENSCFDEDLLFEEAIGGCCAELPECSDLKLLDVFSADCIRNEFSLQDAESGLLVAESGATDCSLKNDLSDGKIAAASIVQSKASEHISAFASSENPEIIPIMCHTEDVTTSVPTLVVADGYHLESIQLTSPTTESLADVAFSTVDGSSNFKNTLLHQMEKQLNDCSLFTSNSFLFNSYCDVKSGGRLYPLSSIAFCLNDSCSDRIQKKLSCALPRSWNESLPKRTKHTLEFYFAECLRGFETNFYTKKTSSERYVGRKKLAVGRKTLHRLYKVSRAQRKWLLKQICSKLTRQHFDMDHNVSFTGVGCRKSHSQVYTFALKRASYLCPLIRPDFIDDICDVQCNRDSFNVLMARLAKLKSCALREFAELLRSEREPCILQLEHLRSTIQSAKRISLPIQTGALGFSVECGIVVPDDRVLQGAAPDDIEEILETFETWQQRGEASWRMKLHSQVVLQLADMKKNLQPDSAHHLRVTKLLVLLTKFRKSGIVELLPKHDCDSSPKSTLEYLSCIENLKNQSDESAKCIVLSNLNPQNANEFHRRRITVMNLRTFSSDILRKQCDPV